MKAAVLCASATSTPLQTAALSLEKQSKFEELSQRQ